MVLHEKIKNIRENKKITQSYLAHELGLDQSQYSRREKGEIPFVASKITKLAKILETTISNLFDEEPLFSVLIKGDNFSQYITVSPELIENQKNIMLLIQQQNELIVKLLSKQ